MSCAALRSGVASSTTAPRTCISTDRETDMQTFTLSLCREYYFTKHQHPFMCCVMNLRSRRTSGARRGDYSANRSISCREPRRRSSGYFYPLTDRQCSPAHRTKYTFCLKVMENVCKNTKKYKVYVYVCMCARKNV